MKLFLLLSATLAVAMGFDTGQAPAASDALEAKETLAHEIQKRSEGHGGRFYFNVRRSVDNNPAGEADADAFRPVVPNEVKSVVKRSKTSGGRGRFHFNVKRDVNFEHDPTSEAEEDLRNDSAVKSIVKRSKSFAGHGGRFHFSVKRSVDSNPNGEVEPIGRPSSKKSIVKRAATKHFGGHGSRFHFNV